MNENEIIEYLKQNKEKGIAFNFMPSEVREWCEEHKDESIFNVYYSDGWNIIKSGITCCYAGIYSLPDDYEQKTEFKPHWEEFDIDKNGFFVEEQVNTHVSPRVYHWWQWTRFLSDHDAKYNDFGGWVYEDPISEDGKKAELLVTSPRILKRGRGLTSCLLFSNGKNEAEPAYPAKILFWRYAE